MIALYVHSGLTTIRPQAKPGPALYSPPDPQIRGRAPLPLVSQDRPSLAACMTPHHVHGNVAKDITPVEYRPCKSHASDRPCTTGLITSAAHSIVHSPLNMYKICEAYTYIETGLESFTTAGTESAKETSAQKKVDNRFKATKSEQ